MWVVCVAQSLWRMSTLRRRPGDLAVTYCSLFADPIVKTSPSPRPGHTRSKIVAPVATTNRSLKVVDGDIRAWLCRGPTAATPYLRPGSNVSFKHWPGTVQASSCSCAVKAAASDVRSLARFSDVEEKLLAAFASWERALPPAVTVNDEKVTITTTTTTITNSTATTTTTTLIKNTTVITPSAVCSHCSLRRTAPSALLRLVRGTLPPGAAVEDWAMLSRALWPEDENRPAGQEYGKDIVTVADASAAVKAGAKLTYGELCPKGVRQLLGPGCLAAAGGLLVDLGAGLAKLAIQV